ncbi:MULTISPECIES: epoxide hydrolase family protein [unclassified Cupriavidus]|uniref:epoxide hydrolase family protein n=1 Tax=Cupriavidus sp. U2 TaxID=2920269 RepID=UPI00129D3077|nr:epoxide hydrolase [Cupriavidus sp. U2]KAI3591736.1 Epoxide hydrolase [Cupriavidus sp. U2]
MTSYDSPIADELVGTPDRARRRLLLGGMASGALAMMPGATAIAASARAALDATQDNIRPFRANFPQAALNDLKRRLAATRWPDAGPVADRSQGVQLDKMQSLTRYWATSYDWRKAESRLNGYPQFVTRIDGVDVHFVHVRSRHANALPLVMTHGWPGSIFELLGTIGPLTDPTAHGGTAEDAFHLVLPSIPGFGFSQKPMDGGWNPERIAHAWDTLMKRLGYHRYVSQGGDWGAIISDAIGRLAPEGLLGIHVNRIERGTTLPGPIAMALKTGGPAPANLTAEETLVLDEARDFLNKGFGYAAIMQTRPQTVGYGQADSPVALAAWIYDKQADWVFTRGDPERALGRDALLDNITFYWLTNTGASSGRIYWETSVAGAKSAPVTVPVAVTIFPGEVYRPPKHWLEQTYPKLVYYNRVDKGGHFAAWEEPELFSKELRSAFSYMRKDS